MDRDLPKKRRMGPGIIGIMQSSRGRENSPPQMGLTRRVAAASTCPLQSAQTTNPTKRVMARRQQAHLPPRCMRRTLVEGMTHLHPGQRGIKRPGQRGQPGRRTELSVWWQYDGNLQTGRGHLDSARGWAACAA
ncbi:hypothetical protein NDU88_004520 [Pleurodeles waltl]|uniref:Uncharacterized protein n=1 Tax=Pleurodeles waltl TaxID=8319 RepID=A0AAV7M8L0_PLEWA|nr:hypothetical protein NDU88_004520 [Pleurodeles waltl]